MIKRAVSLFLFALCALALSFASAQPGDPQCDVNIDGKVDLVDIQTIRAWIGMAVIPAGGPGDPNGDGVVTINDVRACTLRCTKPKCAP